ncbi:hypothetical protein [Empedobacter tilapiae]
MKKLLLILITFLSVNSFAQDKEYIKKINFLSKEEAIKIGWEIVNSTRYKFVMQSPDETDKGLALLFLRKDVVDSARQNNIKTFDLNTDNSVYVWFKKKNVGGNSALEIKGTDMFELYQVGTKFLDIFPYWQKYFYPKSTQESLLKNYKERSVSVKVDNNTVSYELDNDLNKNNLWILKKYGSL